MRRAGRWPECRRKRSSTKPAAGGRPTSSTSAPARSRCAATPSRSSSATSASSTRSGSCCAASCRRTRRRRSSKQHSWLLSTMDPRHRRSRSPGWRRRAACRSTARWLRRSTCSTTSMAVRASSAWSCTSRSTPSSSGTGDLEEAVRLVVQRHRDAGVRYIPGFGHRFHPLDPRTPRLLSLVDAAAAEGVGGRPLRGDRTRGRGRDQRGKAQAHPHERRRSDGRHLLRARPDPEARARCLHPRALGRHPRPRHRADDAGRPHQGPRCRSRSATRTRVRHADPSRTNATNEGDRQ